MKTPQNPHWLDWSMKLHSIAQIGLTSVYTILYDIERYAEIRKTAAEMLAQESTTDVMVIYDLFSRETGCATHKVDVRRSSAENVVLEFYEESGFVTHASKILAIFDRSKHPHEPPFPFHI